MKWFRNSSLATKLVSSTVFGGISLLVVGLINFMTLKNVLKHYTHVAEVNLVNAEHLGNMREKAAILGVHLNELYREFTKGNFASGELEELEKGVNAYIKYDKTYSSMEFAAGEAELYKPVNEHWTKNLDLLTTIRKIYSSKDLSQKEKFEEIMEQATLGLKDQLAKIEVLNDFHHSEAKKWVESAESSASTGQIVALSAIIIFFVLAIVVGLVLSRFLSNKMRYLAEALNKGADEVAKSSQGLSSTAQELSQATTEQAASLEETAASIEEMASMVAKNSENSNSSAELAAQSESSAGRGEEVVKHMISSMEDINKSNQDIMGAINQSNREISEIIKVITEIGNKTKVINDIVFQTKLLSFNASVEAARAGEHGKGFAVVAEEVGNLAQMSGNAAKEISSMLEGSIQKVESIVRDTQNRVERLIEDGSARVTQGTNIAKQCGEVLHEIVQNVSRVTKMATEISAASNEQSKGVSEISKAMNQLDHVTQQNAQTSDATAHASEDLSSHAVGLKNTVSKLLREIEGPAFQNPTTSANKSGEPKKANPKVEKNNVTQFKPKSAASSVSKPSVKKVATVTPTSQPLKAAVGSGVAQQTPSLDDSRFEDV